MTEDQIMRLVIDEYVESHQKEEIAYLVAKEEKLDHLKRKYNQLKTIQETLA